MTDVLDRIKDEGRRLSELHAQRNIYGDFYDPFKYFNFQPDGARDITIFDSVTPIRRNIMHARQLEAVRKQDTTTVISGMCILPRSRQSPPYNDLPSMQLVQNIRIHQDFDANTKDHFGNSRNLVVVPSREYRHITGSRYNMSNNSFNGEFDALLERLYVLAGDIPNNLILDTENKNKELGEIKDVLRNKREVKRRLGHYDGRSIYERVSTLGVPPEVIQEAILDTAATIYYPIAFGRSQNVIVLGSFNEMQTTEIIRNSCMPHAEDVNLVPFVYLPDIINPDRPMHAAGTANGLLTLGDPIEERYQDKTAFRQALGLAQKLRNATGHCKGGSRGILDYLICSPHIEDSVIYEVISRCPIYSAGNKNACRGCERIIMHSIPGSKY